MQVEALMLANEKLNERNKVLEDKVAKLSAAHADAMLELEVLRATTGRSAMSQAESSHKPPRAPLEIMAENVELATRVRSLAADNRAMTRTLASLRSQYSTQPLTAPRVPQQTVRSPASPAVSRDDAIAALPPLPDRTSLATTLAAMSDMVSHLADKADAGSVSGDNDDGDEAARVADLAESFSETTCECSSSDSET
ncbi:uncharacterized protein AMSG_04864 [Thecamonas trahens ATCC 50062]|uniref:Uncharacterized protein n=1 Tax=Thecamonas trahens ATCC 50062 TaxID=461836 RepID=A0A0L0D7Q2_THETB|nr:hypothetical protein AMSG_04864 [Thecamonas trahens ATCC 50062]KNC48417.1 hypothetical protein AMSG_04864 [Thecamonas trahens ATCC 50062]|eukprot:XP_013758533.1 hypothetical protein AMSG_04864 [Thecamonas trahens ATCC 50062]